MICSGSLSLSQFLAGIESFRRVEKARESSENHAGWGKHGVTRNLRRY